MVQKSGAWYSYGDLRMGQGRENSKQYLKDNPESRDAMAKEVKAFLGLDGADEIEDKRDGKEAEAKAG